GRTFVDDGTGGVLQVVEGCYTPPASNCSANCQGSFNGPQAPPCPAGPPQQFQAVKVTATRNGVNVLTAALIPINVGLTSLNITKQAIAAIVGVNAVGPGLPVTLCPELLAKLQPGQTCVQDAVLQCGSCTGSAQVLDFVTLHIADPSQVVASGAAANKGIHNATQVCDNTLPASSGSINSGLYASRQVTLVQ